MPSHGNDFSPMMRCTTLRSRPDVIGIVGCSLAHHVRSRVFLLRGQRWLGSSSHNWVVGRVTAFQNSSSHCPRPPSYLLRFGVVTNKLVPPSTQSPALSPAPGEPWAWKTCVRDSYSPLPSSFFFSAAGSPPLTECSHNFPPPRVFLLESGFDFPPVGTMITKLPVELGVLGTFGTAPNLRP